MRFLVVHSILAIFTSGLLYDVAQSQAVCGQSGRYTPRVVKGQKADGRIVGGVEANPYSFPWIGSLQNDSKHMCGVSLIRVDDGDYSDIAVTAAHCTTRFKAGKKEIRFGIHDLNQPKGLYEQRVTAVNHSHHHLYERTIEFAYYNDIAIIKFKPPVQFTDQIQPVCLPEQGETVPDGAEGTAIGWGYLSEKVTNISNILKQVTLPAVNIDECSDMWMSLERRPVIVDKRSMLCAGYTDREKDACHGDSGGPLTFASGKGAVLKGIVSFGEGCARKDIVGIFTRVSNFVKWVKDEAAKITSIRAKNQK